MANILDDRKKKLFKELLFNIVKEQKLNTDFKKYLKEDLFLEQYSDLFKNISDKFTNDERISEQFINENYGILLEKSDKTQTEIIEQINNIYMSESLNREMGIFQKDKTNNFMKAYNKLTQAMNLLKLKMEKVSYLSLSNEEALEQIFEKMVDGSNAIEFGMKGIDDLKPEKGQVVAFLGATGSGKSVVLQKLHALVMSKYKVAHFSLELSELSVMKRLIGALGWFPSKSLDLIEPSRSRQIIKKFRDYSNKYEQLIITVEKGKVDLAKIEKILSQEKPDIVFIDYVQKINEEFDPNSSKATVTQTLNEFAVKYNVLIIIAIQTNDAGRNIKDNDKDPHADVPHLTHIARMKSIADDCTFVVGVASKKRLINKEQSEIKFITRKHRNDFWCNFTYHANINIGQWELAGEVDTNIAESDKQQARDMIASWEFTD